MQRKISKWLLANTIWLSILLHLLLFLSFSTMIMMRSQEEKKKSPHLYVPSYVYSGVPSTFKSNQQSQKMEMSAQKSISLNKAKQGSAPPKKTAHPKSMFAASLAILQAMHRKEMLSYLNTEPVYLIGDLNETASPLIILLGKALSAHFEYPKTAGMFGIKGRVLVSMTLHPEGHLSNVKMLRSSHSEELDAAALYAANTAPIVKGADRFLSKPKQFVIGFVFK